MCKPYTTHSAGDVYLPLALLCSFSFHLFSKPPNISIESAAYALKFFLSLTIT